MSPDAESRIIRDLGILVRGESQRSKEITELTATMRSHETRDEERHLAILSRLDKLEARDEKHNERIGEITGKHEITEKMKVEIAKLEAEQRAKETAQKTEAKEAVAVQRDWFKFLGTPMLALFGTIAAVFLSRLLGLK